MFRDADVGGSLQRYLMQISTGTIIHTHTHTHIYIHTSTYYLILERNAIRLPGSRDYAARLRVNIGRTRVPPSCATCGRRTAAGPGNNTRLKYAKILGAVIRGGLGVRKTTETQTSANNPNTEARVVSDAPACVTSAACLLVYNIIMNYYCSRLIIIYTAGRSFRYDYVLLLRIIIILSVHNSGQHNPMGI